MVTAEQNGANPSSPVATVQQVASQNTRFASNMPYPLRRRAVNVASQRGGGEGIQALSQQAPTIPVKTSPVPPAASAGLANGNTQRLPSGEATTL